MIVICKVTIRDLEVDGNSVFGSKSKKVRIAETGIPVLEESQRNH